MNSSVKYEMSSQRERRTSDLVPKLASQGSSSPAVSKDVSLGDLFDDESWTFDCLIPAATHSEIETQAPASTTPAPAKVMAMLCSESKDCVTRQAPVPTTTEGICAELAQLDALRPVLLPGPRLVASVPALLPDVALATARMTECFAAGEYGDCLETAHQIIAQQPDHAGALGYASSCGRLLEQRYAERIGELTAIPRVAVTPEQLHWLALDHREGFLISLCDGRTSIDELCDIAGMDRIVALKTLAGLIASEVLRLR
jgi:hypothetical protein